jgi:ABC-type dipeptide/oligopeptide/nickel transport system permease subunit
MASQNDVARARRDGVLFGIPLGDLGWFASLLMGLTTGMVAFFLTTFVAIVIMLIEQSATHRVPAYDMAYKHFGLPVGGVVLVVAMTYLGVQWARRMARRRRRTV